MNFEEMFADGERSGARSPGRDVSGYVVAGRRVPSVTEVLQLASLSDIERIKRVAGEGVVEAAADRGRLVHGYCELADLESDLDLATVPDHARGFVAGYARFAREMNFRPQMSEEVVVSEIHRFAGTLDRVGVLLGRLTLIDIKTPAASDPAWAIQTAGYAIAVDEMFGESVDRACLQLRPNGTWKLFPYSSPEDVPTFLAALRVAHYRLAHGLATLED